ncbi:MAG: CHAT domain-containing tetratricopeptide repeat protein [Bacteroidota bacterium]
MIPTIFQGQNASNTATIDYMDEARAVYLQDLDSAIHIMELGAEYYELNGNNEQFIICLNGIGTCSYYKGDFQKAFEYLYKALDASEELFGKEHATYSNSLNNLASLQSDLGEYENAIKGYRIAAEIDKEDNIEDLLLIYNNIGKCYEKQGDIEEAIVFYKKALSLQINLPDAKNINFAACYDHLARAFMKQNLPEIAFEAQEKALYYFKKSKDAEGEFIRSRITLSYWNLLEIALKLKNDEEIIDRYAQQAIAYEVNYLPRLSSKGLSMLGEIELRKKNYYRAIQYFKDKLIHQTKQYEAFAQHPEIGLTYTQLANAYYKLNDYTKSLNYYQFALNHMAKNFSSTDVYELPDFKTIIKDQNVLKVLFAKAQTFCQLAIDKDEKKLTYLDAAEQTFDLAIQLINHLRKNLNSQDSKVELGEMANLIYKQAVKCNYIQYQLNPSVEQLEKIFKIVESGKAAILLESINDNTAKGFAGIPDSLVAMDNRLKKEILNIQELLYNLENKDERNQKQIDYLENKLFNAKNEHTDFLTYLESNYPEYYNLKYDQRLISLKKVKGHLPDTQSAIVEYFMGDDELYIIWITKENSNIVSVALDSNLTKQVENLRHLLHHPPGHTDAKEDFERFEQCAYYLYSNLIAPLDIPSSIHRLIIIPDDILGYVPFEVLIQNTAPNKFPSYHTDHLNYLLNDYALSYNYSVTLWGQETRFSEGKGYLGVAPNFDNSYNQDLILKNDERDLLNRLKCNEEEIESVSDIIPGLTLMGNTATKEKTLEHASDFQILHFATHSSIDDENPMLNKIYLNDTYLSNYDLYNIRLNADLAVLSACNTGNGRLRSGEGIMSIFRGFLHAGCPSSLISLWSVEDCSTQAIIRNYFAELANGKSKDIALQTVKKNFVNDADRLHAHPFYWAAFVQFGLVDAIEFRERNNVGEGGALVWGALILLIVGLVFWIVKSRLNKAT